MSAYLISKAEEKAQKVYILISLFMRKQIQILK